MAWVRQNNLKKTFLFKWSPYSDSNYAISDTASDMIYSEIFTNQCEWFSPRLRPMTLCSIQVHQSVLMIQFDWLIHKNHASVLLFANLQFLMSNYGSYWDYGFNNDISFSRYLNITELVVCSVQTDSLTHLNEPYRLTGADCTWYVCFCMQSVRRSQFSCMASQFS